MGKTKNVLKNIGILYLIIFALLFIVIFIYPKPIVYLLNMFRYHGRLTVENYTKVFHLPASSLLNNWLQTYHTYGHTRLISAASGLGTIFLFLITANNTLWNMKCPKEKKQWFNFGSDIVKLITSAILSYFTALLTSVCLLSESQELSNQGMSIISITGITAIISIAISQNK